MNRFAKIGLVVALALTAFVVMGTVDAEAGCYSYGYSSYYTPTFYPTTYITPSYFAPTCHSHYSVGYGGYGGLYGGYGGYGRFGW